MLSDWSHWISSLNADQVIWALIPILLLDGPRYTLGALAVWIWDFVSDISRLLAGRQRPEPFAHCPSVCVIVAGLNEAETLPHTLTSVWNSYPRMEIIVVDDGSTDGMARAATDFADRHAGVKVLTKSSRGGKSSALNFALPFTSAEIIVCVDADSHLGPNAIWELVQPFADPKVGAVSAAVMVRNALTCLVTRLQALEYLRSIFLGRIFADRMQTLGIVSGAFGAYQRDALLRAGGWDVGPGEDGDVTLRLRKSGYDIAFAPYAQCFTNAPSKWKQLINQRRRWEWALVTFECRKHVDLANPRHSNFRWSNFLMLLDRWTFNLVLQMAFWSYIAWLMFHANDNTWKLFLLDYLIFFVFEILQLGVVLYYSSNRARDLHIGLAAPLMPLYHVFLRAVMFVGVIEEFVSRRSRRDGFVPEHVQRATWRW